LKKKVKFILILLMTKYYNSEQLKSLYFERPNSTPMPNISFEKDAHAATLHSHLSSWTFAFDKINLKIRPIMIVCCKRLDNFCNRNELK